MFSLLIICIISTTNNPSGINQNVCLYDLDRLIHRFYTVSLDIPVISTSPTIIKVNMSFRHLCD